MTIYQTAVDRMYSAIKDRKDGGRMEPIIANGIANAQKYVHNVGKLVAKNDKSNFTGGSKFATVLGVCVDNEGVPNYMFLHAQDIIPCHKCRLAK